eukprot:gene9187-14746_t
MRWPHVTKRGLVALQSEDYKGVQSLQPLQLQLGNGGALTATKGGKGKQQNVPVLQGFAVAVDPYKDLPSIRYGFAVVLRPFPPQPPPSSPNPNPNPPPLSTSTSTSTVSADQTTAVFSVSERDQLEWVQAIEAALIGNTLCSNPPVQLANWPSGGPLGDILGKGSFGVVARGRLCLLGGSTDENPEELIEFTLEVGLLSQLDHHCILKLYGVALLPAEDVEDIIGSSGSSGSGGGDGGESSNVVLAMVSEWCPNGSARELLHAIGDFGQSRRVTLSRTMTANVRGSLLWRAPEMTSGNILEASSSSSIQRSAQYDTKVDIYSFGIIMWEIWTQREPYADVPQIFDIKQGVESGTLRPAAPDDDWPPRVKTLASWCWFPDPDGRPTADEILAWMVDPNLLTIAAEDDGDSGGVGGDTVGTASEGLSDSSSDGVGATADSTRTVGPLQHPHGDVTDESWLLVPNKAGGGESNCGRGEAVGDAPPEKSGTPVQHPATLGGAAAGGGGGGDGGGGVGGGVEGDVLPKSPLALLSQVLERASFEFVAVTDFPAMVIAMRRPPKEGGLAIRDRSWLGFSVQNCFEGKELVQWLRQRDPTCTESSANSFGEKLQKLGFIRHSVASRKWSQRCFFYWQSSQIVKRLLLLEETKRFQACGCN